VATLSVLTYGMLQMQTTYLLTYLCVQFRSLVLQWICTGWQEKMGHFVLWLVALEVSITLAPNQSALIRS